MPTITSRGAGSAQGFGFAGKTLSIVSRTFTSNTTFVAPTGVTNLIAVIGRGGSSTSDFQTSIAVAEVNVSNSASGSGTNSLRPPISTQAVYNTADICASVYNAGGYRDAYRAVNRDFTFYSNQTYSWSDSYPYGSGSTLFPYYLVAGTWSLQGSPLSGSLNYGDSASYYASGGIIQPGSSGGNTTAFGFTFTGAAQVGAYPTATGQSATSVTYNNVAVTPGNSYTIGVASGGAVTIQYLA